MSRLWREAGHRVRVVTSDQSHDARQRGWSVERRDGLEIHRLGVPYRNAMSYAERIRAFFRFASASTRRAADLGGDVVFATSTPLTIALPAIYLRRRHRIPFVFEVRDLWPEIPIAMGALSNPVARHAARRLEREAYRHAQHVVALSPGMREGVIRGGKEPERVSVVPNSCDLDRFDVPERAGLDFRAARPWLGSAPLVVYAGTLGRANGVAYLARLAASCRAARPDLRFLVVGQGAESEAIEGEAKELGVWGETFFMEGPMPKREMPALLSAADLCCSLFVDEPTLRHNSANKFFDALAAGRPVAVNHRGWIPGLVESEGCGLCLDVDPLRAAPQLLDWFEQPQRGLEAGRRARALGETRFDRRALSMQIEAQLRLAAGR